MKTPRDSRLLNLRQMAYQHERLWFRLDDNSVAGQYYYDNHDQLKASKLSGHSDRYKIKLRKSGYRLFYEVVDDRLVILVIAIGKRDREAVYEKAGKR